MSLRKMLRNIRKRAGYRIGETVIADDYGFRVTRSFDERRKNGMRLVTEDGEPVSAGTVKYKAHDGR